MLSDAPIPCCAVAVVKTGHVDMVGLLLALQPYKVGCDVFVE